MKINVYDALAAMYDFKVNGLSLRAMKDDLADADKIQRDIDEYSRLADDCRVKARNVKPVAGTNGKPTLEQVERRAQSINLTIRQFGENFVLADKVDFNVLPLYFSTLGALDAFLDLSGVLAADDSKPTINPNDFLIDKITIELPFEISSGLRAYAFLEGSKPIEDILTSQCFALYCQNKRRIEYVREQLPDVDEFFVPKLDDKKRQFARQKLANDTDSDSATNAPTAAPMDDDELPF